jgi:sugar fermentation stimulation protein A
MNCAAAYAGLKWPRLVPGTLVRRYRRFLTEVRLKSGEVVIAHCPNTGSMQGCCEPGRPAYVSVHDDPKRKLKYTWQLIAMPTSLVGINTLIPNRLVFRSVQQGLIPELKGYGRIEREVAIGNHTRLDLMLADEHGRRCYVEIKNCTLSADGVAFFPDAVTARGLKHLVEMQLLAASGARCVMFYLIQRMDADVFRPADHIDPAYARELRRAAENGVQILAYDVRLDLHGIALNRRLPCEL